MIIATSPELFVKVKNTPWFFRQLRDSREGRLSSNMPSSFGRGTKL